MPPHSVHKTRSRSEVEVRAFKKQLACVNGFLSALSCAERRHLKLRCDKTVPRSRLFCDISQRESNHWSRDEGEAAWKLPWKIAHTISDRIRQLEDALAILQSTVSKEPHPLLDRELLKLNRDQVEY
ncbi:uncharacterized protein LACBIDRAFT_317114 [Laccaria bicolor S238N-H82]|uniref:Predicted protein n=1 Tax=Laccaria bicolor (strain S238N-H82 / ATCC MYA-4686) TaxID=486041 RepID=B0D4F8_LACBS|nr:uncharacterized protein LACBIDRAFT_317114 [Laccaria bicolor S238N-H82]EDR10555.1 predicted protein [Laccaria bicolor S238N-H82]|eukprot:XP_001879005.1 predicted protein [Laccaria bicolor S238N-H82]